MINELLVRLINQGDAVSIENGRLNIVPKSGKKVPPQWLKTNREMLLRAILSAAGMDALAYVGFGTGVYHAKLAPGVHLRYRWVLSGSDADVFFNACLVRKRTTRGGMKGDPLPDGHFRVGERSSFTKFWRRLDLAIPRSMSEFHDCMGRLKPVYLQAEMMSTGKVNKGSLRPLNVTADQLRQAVASPDRLQVSEQGGTDNAPVTHRKIADNLPVTHRELLPGRRSPEPQYPRGLQRKSGTGNPSAYEVSSVTGNDDGFFVKDRENMVGGGADSARLRRSARGADVRPQEQSREEWLSDYGEGS